MEDFNSQTLQRTFGQHRSDVEDRGSGGPRGSALDCSLRAVVGGVLTIADRATDPRAHDEDLVACLDFLANALPGALEKVRLLSRRHYVTTDLLTSSW